MRHRIFLPLLLVLSATAFSASAMAASDSPPPPDNTKHASRGWPPDHEYIFTIASGVVGYSLFGIGDGCQ
ncbi:PagK family vesicle-borne virulence factor [Salmonella enterica]|uniref:PagK family vesicle-borne virulence factor n=1 Tax=Salmonella enterica TaxID=28901 RepID=UPI000906E8EF|nr:PagK family vesicle-borne virulence factor [Salmonella enterica]